MSDVPYERWKGAQDAERKFRSLYEDIPLPATSGYLTANFSLDPEFFADKSILEIGCSPSADIHLLHQARLRVGLDPLAGEWKDLYREGTSNTVGVSEYLPFGDEAFDVVLCLNVIDHVQNPAATLTEAQRVLKAGGALLLSSHAYATPRMVRRSLGLIDRPHPHHFSGAELSALISGVRFQVVRDSHRRIGPEGALRHVNTGKASLLGHYLKFVGGALFLGLQESFYLCIKPDGERVPLRT